MAGLECDGFGEVRAGFFEDGGGRRMGGVQEGDGGAKELEDALLAEEGGELLGRWRGERVGVPVGAHGERLAVGGIEGERGGEGLFRPVDAASGAVGVGFAEEHVDALEALDGFAIIEADADRRHRGGDGGTKGEERVLIEGEDVDAGDRAEGEEEGGGTQLGEEAGMEGGKGAGGSGAEAPAGGQ